MPSSWRTRAWSGSDMDMAKRARSKASRLAGGSEGRASNWQWLKGGSGMTTKAEASRSPALTALVHMMVETKSASTRPSASAWITSSSPAAVSPCFPTSRSKRIRSISPRTLGSCSLSAWSGRMQPCGESKHADATFFPARSDSVAIPDDFRATTLDSNPTSTSRIPSDRDLPPVRFWMRTWASGPLHATSISPDMSASTCRS
mmetsp:Transcript_8260/g.25588  ORF Transcript_8260/g.25588 Transcript_8260/m.25588 type:complete len:203 (-) Transcript_8260:276-884(-)